MAIVYDFAYRLQAAPEARRDGSGQVGHDIMAVYRENGTSDPWAPIPGHHKTVIVPSADLKIVMDMPHSTGPQQTAKNAAYKELLRTNKNTQPEPMNTNWNDANFQDFMEANDSAATEAARADDYVTVTLAASYPMPFQL